MDNHKQYLSDTEIIEVIKSYIAEKLYNYAVMIDGEWGSGKTYFVKEILIPKLKDWEKEKSNNQDDYKPKKIIYISLYGVKRVEDISKSIYMENYLDSDKKKKGYSFGSSAVSLGFDILKNKGIDLDREAIKDLLSQFMSLESSILIFDDLERCNIPVNEVLGYINGFVEHQAMKVIIVANQKELLLGFDDNNIELKYMVVLNNNLQISSDAENSDKESLPGFIQKSNDNSTQNNCIFNESELKERAEKLFEHKTDYERMREKLIGISIYYQPDLYKTFKNIIENSNIDNELKKIIKEKTPDYIEIMNLLRHYNMRTFQFYLSKINFLYPEIKNLDKKSEGFLNYVVGYCFEICCRFKSGEIDYKWGKGLISYEHEQVTINSTYQKFSFRIKFVDDYVIYSHYNQSVISNIIKEYNRNYGKNVAESSQLLVDMDYGWFCYTQNKVEDSLNRINQYLQEDLYNKDDYHKIIHLFLKTDNIGIDPNFLETMKKHMLTNIKKSKNYYRFDEAYASIIDNKNIKMRFKDIIKTLQNTMDETINNNKENDIHYIISHNEDWAYKIYKLSQDKNSVYYAPYSVINIFEYVDIHFLVSKIIVSTSKNLFDLRRFFSEWKEVYHEYNHVCLLLKLYDILSRIDIDKLPDELRPDDLIIKMQLNYLINDLNHYAGIPFEKLESFQE